MFYIYERSSTHIMGKISKYDGEVRPDHSQSEHAGDGERSTVPLRYRRGGCVPQYYRKDSYTQEHDEWCGVYRDREHSCLL